jgi:hypothetical protein
MAVAGGITTAYKCQVSEYRLHVQSTSYPKAECANIEAAIQMLQAGESCIVAGGDVAKLRQRLASFGVS